MTKLLIKAAAVLAVSELAVMCMLHCWGVEGHQFEVILDPLMMILLALGPLYLLLRGERAKAQRQEALDNKLHTIVDDLWSASLHTLSSDALLGKILSEILDNSPISIQHKGAIFLTEDGKLRLKASIGFSKEQKLLCGVVPPGKCFCGTVLETGESVYAATVDNRHHIQPPGITPHGHYCFPIKSSGQVLGALNLYLEPGHTQDEAEEKFLRSVCAIIARIIEGKKLERSLFQMQKMEALNRFAAGIAHDFNNILGAIQGYCDVTTRTLPPGSQTACDIREISEAAGRGAELTRQLKLFSRQAEETAEIFDINRELEQTGRMIRRLIGGGVDTEFRFSASPLPIKGSRGQLGQVIMNLAANARDAMPSGGRFIITTSSQEVCLTASKRCFKAACITVTDTGEGMNEEVLEKIFEPFFTTKQDGKGSGLGLSIIYGVVQQHGGEILVRSTPGEGTRFDIYLPLADTLKSE